MALDLEGLYSIYFDGGRIKTVVRASSFEEAYEQSEEYSEVVAVIAADLDAALLDGSLARRSVQ